ncbi:MAG: DEAD/DEAH box helicase, partial [Chloroflexota bacterium]
REGGVATGTAESDTFRVCFRLDPPPAEGEASAAPPQASKAGPAAAWQLSYFLQAADDPSLLVPAGEAWRLRGATLRYLNRRFDQPQERLLAGLGRAARLVPPIEASLRQTRPEACALSTSEAHHFLKEAALLLRTSGFGVLVPGLEATLRLRVRLGSAGGPGGPADPAKSAGRAGLSWDSLVAYDWQVALGDETLTREEFEQLARLKEPLVQVRGRWVELDPEQVAQALAFFERRTDVNEMALPNALRLALAPESLAGATGLPIAAVETTGWLDDLLRDLGQGRRGDQRGQREPVPEPRGFVGQLRPYQKIGVSWLAALRRYGLGACLADDMGLGKTPTTIALWLHERAAQRNGRQRRTPHAAGAPAAPPAPVLLICPTSVVGNWQREVARFAPDLKVLVHHGAGRTREQFAATAAAHDVVISTYALLHRDESALREVEWAEVVLDEAQNIKNAATKTAQAARRLRAGWRAALTGTPVENRVSELWSLFQFLNPGYLGAGEDFRHRFGNPIERANDASATAQLKALVAPFILRRVKSDRAIIQDLPEKNEMKVFCPLTREQATLYEAVVRDSMRQIEGSEGVQRRGMILATLTKLKQVCDHPALFLHDASALAGRSGKLARLVEMLEETLAVEDRSLVFTQYAEMGRLLKTHLEARFGQAVLFLHGGTPARERDRLVARFQHEGRAPRVFVLSIKAGGTGLNLTRANHVFHFDRWWNPAVENQATDRAYRIGQQRDVQVHKFLCAGTFEETIDQLIERKVALAQAIVGVGETWITEMNTAELRDLFTLRRGAGDAVVETAEMEEPAGAAA